MSQKQRGLLMVALMLIGAMMLSACEISLSQPPASTPTVIPTGLFVSPFPSVEIKADSACAIVISKRKKRPGRGAFLPFV